MNFQSTTVDSTFNFYTFNDSTGNWTFTEKPKPVTSSTRITMKSSEAARKYNLLMRGVITYKDSLSIEQRFESPDHWYIHNKQKSGLNYHFKSDGKTRTRKYESLVRITRVRKTKDNTILFRLRFHPEVHPELAALGDCYLALDENIQPVDFRKKFVYKKGFSDVRLNLKGTNVEVRLKDGKSIKSLQTHLVRINNLSKVEDAKDQGRIMRSYSGKLKKRIRRMSRELKKDKSNKERLAITSEAEKSRYAYREAMKVMSDEEKALTYEDFISYSAQLQSYEVQLAKEVMANELAKADKQSATATNLIQSLSLSGLGIYNVDQILRLNDPVELFASYKNEDRSLSPSTVFVINKSINAVWKYDGYGGYSPSKLVLSNSASANNVVIAVKQNNIYLYEEKRTSPFSDKQNIEFLVTPVSGKLTSVGELKSSLGL
jgi:hypothetical protein